MGIQGGKVFARYAETLHTTSGRVQIENASRRPLACSREQEP